MPASPRARSPGRSRPPRWRWSPRFTGLRRCSRAGAGLVTDAEVLKITQTHCIACHQAKPTHEAFKGGEPPKGVMLDTVAGLRRNSAQVIAQAVQGRAMPLGNEHGMTDEERAKLGAFLAQQ